MIANVNVIRLERACAAAVHGHSHTAIDVTVRPQQVKVTTRRSKDSST